MKPSLVLFVLFLAFACKDQTTQKGASESEVDVTEETVEVNKDIEQEVTKEAYQSAPTTAVFNDSLVSAGFDQYISLKTALVNSNLEESIKGADALLTTMTNIGVEEPVLYTLQIMKEAASLDQIRLAFTDLTPVMESMVMGGITEGTVYKQYCPMANKNTGAYWLSNSKEIYNPYFGDVMLKCGRVSDQFTSK